MPTTLELCEKYFGTRDVYKLMNLKKDSLEKDGKFILELHYNCLESHRHLSELRERLPYVILHLKSNGLL